MLRPLSRGGKSPDCRNIERPLAIVPLSPGRAACRPPDPIAGRKNAAPAISRRPARGGMPAARDLYSLNTRFALPARKLLFASSSSPRESNSLRQSSGVIIG